MFVALEGSDGTGKSTLLSILASRLGAISLQTPPKEYSNERQRVDKDASLEDHYAFYRSIVYDTAEEIDAILQSGGRVVIDRYFLSTKTYHEVMGMEVPENDFQDVVQPTLTVILSLNHGVQLQRMTGRGLTVGDKRTLKIQRQVAAAYYKNALEMNIPFVILDTQRFTPPECADIIMSALGI